MELVFRDRSCIRALPVEVPVRRSIRVKAVKRSHMTDILKSKRLSYWLRHAPEAAGLKLDPAGWAQTQAILEALSYQGMPTSLAELEALVAASDKQRFEVSPDGKRIRARQGHSIPVQGDWPIAPPPGILFHGTSERFLASILKRGLLPAARHHVHLSSTVEIARAVSARRGQSIVLEVAASKMAADGFTFRLSSNGVWLTDHVPPIYLGEVPD
jgi:putative RNA 2'-phosphotransferase